MTEDDTPTRKAPLLMPPPLDRLGVAELDAYIAALEAEIVRTRAEITRKQAVRAAADSVFKANTQ
jgi:uncharacterized small protein (DUF1192 family)